jgi:hypothetical protein
MLVAKRRGKGQKTDISMELAQRNTARSTLGYLPKETHANL